MLVPAMRSERHPNVDVIGPRSGQTIAAGAAGDGLAEVRGIVAVGVEGVAIPSAPMISSSCPARSDGSLKAFAAISAATVVSYRRAISQSVSPGSTVIVGAANPPWSLGVSAWAYT